MDNIQSPLEEITKKGQAIYETKLKNELERENLGKFVSIDVETQKYFIGDSIEDALQKAKTEFPNKIFYTARIGYTGVFNLSSLRKKSYGFDWFA